jgi:hypothetical protein
MSAARYEMGPELGRGALGRVVRVTDRQLGLELAGKILHASNRDDPAALARFAREAELMQGLDHENVARVHGMAEIDGDPVLLMELVSGPSLARVAAEAGTLAESRILAIGRGIAAGLGAAHRAGIVHRDLKPANVLLLPGDLPKIVDFGMARATSFGGVDRQSFALVGTPDYMAPECLDPLAVDPRSDLYALGCILHELATGRPPYAGPTAFAIMEAHQRAPVPDVPGVSGGLARLTRALLAKSPADRPQSATAVAQALGDAVALAAPRLSGPPAGDACVHCGGALVAGVGVCFGCGAAPIVREPGPMTVWVTGPGDVSHKLDWGLRGRLLGWLRANAQLALDPTPLEKAVPRLPFVLATDLAPGSAERICAGLRALGLEAEAAAGGRLALAGMRSKAWRLAGRQALIGLGALAPMFQLLQKTPGLLPILVALPVLFGVTGLRSAIRKVAVPGPGGPLALRPALAASLARVIEVVPAIAARRHREGLRAVVQRLLALSAALPEDERARIEPELARVLDLAVVAAARLDELERRLSTEDVVQAGSSTRRELQERDAWAARLLDASAQLDALRARWAAAQARGVAADVAEALAELRAEVEAFEEVQRL